MDKPFSLTYKMVDSESKHSYPIYQVMHSNTIVVESRNSVLAQMLCNFFNTESMKNPKFPELIL